MGEMLTDVGAALLPLSSPPTGSGWNHREMSELLGNVPRRPAAVLVGLREGVQPRLVLTVRTDHLQDHAGQVAFPGGRTDPEDADAIATALRESEEEIGLARKLVTPLGFLDRFETISGYCVTPVVARIDPEARLYPAPAEVAEVFEVPLSFFLDPANCGATPWSSAVIGATWWSSCTVAIASGVPPPPWYSIFCRGWVAYDAQDHADRGQRTGRAAGGCGAHCRLPV